MNNLNFNNQQLKFHQDRIFKHLELYPENKGIKTPTRDIGNNGIGKDVYYIDIDVIEETYCYYSEKERDEDYNKLMSIFN